MAQENLNVEFYKCHEMTNTNTVSENGIIINVNGGVYIGNETNEPTLIANKVEKVSDIENDLKYLNEEAVKTINGISLVGQGDIKFENSILSLTYSELVALRDNSQLMPGQQYRITDYVTTTVQENTQSAGHQFDIIVTADDESTLNEVARAIQHDGDTYFANSDLNAWQIWYCLDNDTNKFAWADSANGKGVIYRMIDEFNNECPYDFKNIQFLRGLWDEGGLIPYHKPNGDEDLTAYCYTFGWLNEDGAMLDVTIFGNNGTLLNDEDQISGVYGNIIKANFTYVEYIDNPTNVQQRLNNIVFLSTYYYDDGFFYGYNSNSFGNDCYNNSFGDKCYNNSFGNGCRNNSFGNDCYNNSFGNEYYNNSFGNYCYSNSFGNDCYGNSFGDTCSNNSFGDTCSNNSFGNGCYGNSFENGCGSNSFGDECDDNSFGNGCYNNSFGNEYYNNSFGNNCDSNSFGNDCYNNSFESNCHSNSFGNDCYNNSFVNDCHSNSFGDECISNSFGNRCSNNSFGDFCSSNSFGNSCHNNSFGNECYNNSFGNDCYGNSFGNDCAYNSFGNGCHNNSFGNEYYDNSFGNECSRNSFRNSASETGTLKDYCMHNHFDDGCLFNVIWNSDTTSTNLWLKHININRGVVGTSGSYNFINIETLNSEKEINVNNYNGHIYIDCGDIFKVTYNELVDLRDNSQLIPGRQYRIIDYVTTTSQPYTQSAGHQFDIIVTAVDESTLSENALAAIHDGDTYFAENGANLDAWEIKYALDNDTDKFYWAGNELTISEVVKVTTYDSSECTINSELIDGNTFITPFNFESCVWVDNGDGEGYNNQDSHDIDELVYEWGYFTDENDNTQLCLYKSDADIYEEEGQPDYGDKYLYRGVVNVDGVDYDYWQKWDMESESVAVPNNGDYVYATTSRIVSNPEAYSFETTNETIETTIQLNPKGVIYYMKDEWNNECPYDFKNIMFLRDITIDADSGLSAIAPKSDITQGVYCYTFNYRQSDGEMLDSTIYANNGTLLMFGMFSEVSFNKMNALDTIGLMNLPGINIGLINYSLKQYFLNHIVFYVGGGIYYGPITHNIFGICCQNMTFGNTCNNNSFGDRCYNNLFGKNYINNSFGNDCYNNSFGNGCTDNSFGNSCAGNSFGESCTDNSFGEYCYNNSFGNSCAGNSFGESCAGNSFGNNCQNNSFGVNCSNNSFRKSASKTGTLKDYCSFNHFDDGCSYNIIWNSSTTSSSVQLKNINVNRGVCGTSSSYNYINVKSLNSEQEINVNQVDKIISIGNILSIKYKSLKTLRNKSQLIPGRQYRIIDYVTTTSQVDTQSAGHQFDIIVTAVDESTLNVVTRAIQHDGDTYFANSDLNAWQIWYCLDNDVNRFEWTDSTNGKGVIYRMIDEFNNDCPYDFKNIQFKHPNDTTTYPDYYYTFSTVVGGVVSDRSLESNYCKNNVIKEYWEDSDNIYLLNQNVFINNVQTSYCRNNSFGSGCHNNSFINNCYSNTFGNGCYSNTFGNGCYSNTFGNGCYSNTFGNYCQYNSFGNDCYNNSFVNDCRNNSFGDNCYSNTFGNYCQYNSFGNGCYSNSFGGDCKYNSFGNSCNSNSLKGYCNRNSFVNNCSNNSFGNSCAGNSFGNYCRYNSFRNSASKTGTLKDYCSYNHFDDGCSYNIIWNNSTTSTTIKLKNVNVNRCLRSENGSSYNFINIDVLNQDYEIQVAKNSKGEIKIYCETDLIA